MLFHEPLFLFFILPVMLVLALMLGRNAGPKKLVLLAVSVAIYGWAEPTFVLIALASAFLDHLLARRMALASGNRRLLLWVGVGSNLAILCVYKYLGFISINFAALTNAQVFASDAFFKGLVLPIGISFITFEKISYLVDVYRGVSAPAARLFDYLLYVMFFPKLLAGPIIKYHEISDQIARPSETTGDDLIYGFERFMLGVVKKLLVADPLGGAADAIFRMPDSAIGFHAAWVGAALFTLQIYYDFSAYSDMAIGLARAFGFRLQENFNYPYLSRSMTEFWRRWHISLSTYIRDYLYIPLGGDRGSRLRTFANLWICFLLSGLWHGANWTFVAWGAYNGLFLTLDRICLQGWLSRMPAMLANALLLLAVIFGWVLFRAQSIDQGLLFWKAMLSPASPGSPPGLTTDVPVIAVLAGAICLAPRLVSLDRLNAVFDRAAVRVALSSVLLCGFIAACARSVAVPFAPFLYFRF